MHRRLFLASLVILGLPLALSASPGAPRIVLPGQAHWTTVNSGPTAGSQVAILLGNPAKPGPFIMRVKFKDGARVGVHYHSGTEAVTVISGTVMIGAGDKMVETKTTAVSAGGFYAIPPRVHHYAMFKGETVLQIDGTGPRTFTMVKGGR